MVRSKKTSTLVDSKLRTWLKRHDPAYAEKIKALSKDEEVKQKRNEMGRVRRAGHSATHAIFKKYSPLTDKEGNVYRWHDKYKRLLKNDTHVVRRARNGELHFLAYETEEDLDDAKFDQAIYSPIDAKLCENVEKLLNGDEDMDRKMRKRKFMVERELTDEDCFWKKLNNSEKRKLIKKLRRNVNNKNSIT